MVYPPPTPQTEIGQIWNLPLRLRGMVRQTMMGGMDNCMAYDSQIHHRRSIRLKNYDYSQAGMYFVTICTQNQLHLFGEIVSDKMVLNDAGKMIQKIWNEISHDFSNIQLHEFTMMPNHIHGIIEIPVRADSISVPNTKNTNRAEMDSAPTLSKMVQSFKRHTTIEYIKMVEQNIFPPFDKRIWQRNYWEHIVRNDNEYNGISQYIIDNPATWQNDKLNVGADSISALAPPNTQNRADMESAPTVTVCGAANNDGVDG